MKRLFPRLLGLLGWSALLVVVGSSTVLVLFLLARGLPTLHLTLFFGDTPPLRALFGLQPVWEGLWPACVGTVSLVGVTLALALFPGVGCGLFLAEGASPRQRRWIGCAADVLAGTPSIVMGLFGFTLILFLRRTVWPDANTSLALAAGCLALLVLPVLTVTTREALESLPSDLRLTAAALGLSPSQRLWHVLLPSASRGILGGVMLALGRSAEDTAVIMLTGVVANAGLPAGLGAKFEALPFYIYYTAAQYQSQDELERGFGAALLLLFLSSLLLLGARLLTRTWQRRWNKGSSACL
ncbi:MAG: ABC transporter permease subunit [Bilophila sp.]